MGDADPFLESTTVVAVEDCLSTTIDGEAIILHTSAGKYYGFNEVATYIWEFVQQPRTIEEICQHISAEFDITYDDCRRDVLELIEELSEKEVVNVIES